MGTRPRSTLLGRGVVAFLLAAALVALSGVVVAHTATNARLADSSVLTVSVTDTFRFILSTSEVTPGTNVEVIVVQLGQTPHTFTLSPVANYTFSSTNTTSDLVSFFTAHAPLVNITVGATTGEHDYANFTAPPYGLYEYVCLQPGHFSAGMWGILGSGEAGSAGSTDTGPGAAVFIIGGVIVSLVVIAIVLGFVVGKRRGATHEMPPERLGYSENPSGPTVPKG